MRIDRKRRVLSKFKIGGVKGELGEGVERMPMRGGVTVFLTKSEQLTR